MWLVRGGESIFCLSIEYSPLTLLKKICIFNVKKVNFSEIDLKIDFKGRGRYPVCIKKFNHRHKQNSIWLKNVLMTNMHLQVKKNSKQKPPLKKKEKKINIQP